MVLVPYCKKKAARSKTLGKSAAMKMILPIWFDPLEESFCYTEVQLKMFCLPVKASCPSAESITETLMLLEVCLKYINNYC